MKASIIISYYKNLDNLKVIIEALKCQSENDFEVIIAEDDNSEEAKAYVKQLWSSRDLHILHVNQKDLGFRKNRILNRALNIATGELMVFIDGDCVPHKHFVKEYIGHIKSKTILYGRRVMLSDPLTQKVKSSMNLKFLSTLNVFLSSSSMKEEAIYLSDWRWRKKKKHLLGCNWAVLKSELFEVNGFDEDYIHPGVGEDVDIEWRLMANGCQMYSMRNAAIVYHLYHPRSYSEDVVSANYEMMYTKQVQNIFYCKNGLEDNI